MSEVRVEGCRAELARISVWWVQANGSQNFPRDCLLLGL